MPSDEQIQTIEEKLQALLKRYQRLQKENGNLKAELHDATAKLAIALRENEALHQRLDVRWLGLQQWSEADRQKMTSRIDNYLKEIERCLALLNA